MRNIFLFFVLMSFPVYSQFGILDENFGDGGIVIAEPLPQAYNLMPEAITSDVDGNIYVLSNYMVDNEDFGTILQMLISKFKSDGSVDTSFGINGHLQWVTDFHMEGGDIKVVRDGNLMIAGSYSMEVDVSYPFLLNLDTDGNAVASFGTDGVRFLPINETTYAKRLFQDEGGDFFIGGGAGMNDLFLARTDEAGEMISNFGSAGTGYQVYQPQKPVLFADMARDENGDLYILGNKDFYKAATLFKTNELGELLSSSVFDDPNYFISGIALGNDELYLSGRYGGTGNDGSLYLTAYDKNTMVQDTSFGVQGEVLTEFHFGPYAPTYVLRNINGKITQISSDFSGTMSRFALAGFESDGAVDSEFGEDGITLTAISGIPSTHPRYASFYGTDRILVLNAAATKLSFACYVVDNMLSTIEISDTSDIRIAPNPAASSFIVSGLNGSHNTITIYDLSGKQIREFHSVQNNERIVLGEIPSGTYILKIKSGERIHSQKLLVK